jgi:hypothetical protein
MSERLTAWLYRRGVAFRDWLVSSSTAALKDSEHLSWVRFLIAVVAVVLLSAVRFGLL